MDLAVFLHESIELGKLVGVVAGGKLNASITTLKLPAHSDSFVAKVGPILNFARRQFSCRFWLSISAAIFACWLFVGSADAIQDKVEMPGVLVDESPKPEEWHCAKCSIVVLSNGDYLISNVYVGNDRPEETAIHVSKDKGRSWKKLSTVKNLFGGSFVTKGDQVYLIGIQGNFGRASVVVSSDNGATWSDVSDSLISESRFFSVSAAVLVHDDRIWRSYTSLGPGRKTWFLHLLWAPYESDWLDADSWKALKPATGSTTFLGNQWNPVHQANPIPTRDGVALMAVCNAKSKVDTAALLPVAADGNSLEFAGVNSLIDFPGGSRKFTARYDEQSKKYWAVVNKQKEPFALCNNQVLVSSSDLKTWTVNSVLFRHLNHYYYGKGQADWVIDGDDLILVSMTTWNGPRVAEKPTRVVFDRVKKFRSLGKAKKAKPIGVKSKPFLHASRTMKVTGKYIESQYLKEGIGAVTGYASKYTEVPDRIRNWRFTRTRGGFPCEVKVKANKDCKVLMITDLDGTGVIDVTGWTLEPERLIRDKNNAMGLFSRELKKGETIFLPQGTWTGSQLLIPPGGVEVK